MDERLVACFEMLVERLTDVELTLGALKESRKHEQEDAPSGTELSGALYRRGSRSGELTIYKNYKGRFEEHQLLAITCGGTIPSWWHSLEWACSEERSWVDDAVEAVIGAERAKAVRGRCLALLEARKNDADKKYHVIHCKDVGLDGGSDVHTWWFRTAVMHTVPEVRDLVDEYILLQFDEASSGSIEAIVRVVDRIFDLCAAPTFEAPFRRAPSMEVYILPPSLTELAAAKYHRGAQDLKELWASLTAERREEIITTEKDWTARRCRMIYDERRIDDLENFVSHHLLRELLANA
jgi:hypothetical protein